MEIFDYSQVPYGFGLCASSDCAKTSTCLRHIALEHAPVKYPFLPTLTPNKLKAMQGKCEYYCPNDTVRYAKGFTRAIESLTVRNSDTFRWRLISHFGRKNYYLVRKGDLLIKPADQQYIIRIAKECGLQLDDYFDDYVDAYSWGG
ncbi:DUF6078 family protein [Bacteroides sp. GD17]|jgi:hypothetical protein|uniref:DUF6078 family protein n=1 Tax=Bacteroides sp. GD17 TaxID=3139826 RepID=UPI0025FC9DBB|nr:DUF6078 family protein [uncultured Bacteroides sp.]